MLQLPSVGGCFKCEASPLNILCESCLKKENVEVILLSILNNFLTFQLLVCCYLYVRSALAGRMMVEG